MVFSRNEILADLSDRTGVSRRKLLPILMELDDVIVDALERGEIVRIPGLLTLKTKTYAPRHLIHPTNRKDYHLPERKRVKAVLGRRLLNLFR